MPGISDKRSLMHAVIDSLSVTKSTGVRLASRGLRDVKSALRLRRVEIGLLKSWEREQFDDLSKEAKRCLVEKLSGNHYYYRFGLYILNLLRDKEFIMSCRSPRVVKQFQMAGKLLEIKVPAEEYHNSITSFPEGYQRIHNIYIALRSLHDHLFQMHSNCGRNRGKLQSLNTTNKQDVEFLKGLKIWILKEEELLKKEGARSSYFDKLVLDKRKYVEMVRISDLIYMRVSDTYSETPLLLTANHFERCTGLIRQISNIMLGSLLAYGQEGIIDSEAIVWDIVSHLKSLYKLGIKDDLAVGETGKAITDLYKAKLSQSDELPWDNYRMLLQTYSDKRQYNAAELFGDFRILRHDPDVLLNMSYVWKTAAQPDSSIRDDFMELIGGLGKPNPIKPEAPEMIEVAIRRAVLVGALKENRQVAVTAEPGVVIARELREAVGHSFPGEKQLRMVTHGMLKGVKISVPNVFPSPFDVSHLMFKDKSSSIERESIRVDIRERSEAEEEIIQMEDESIREHAELAADKFLEAIYVEPTKEGVNWALRATANDILTSLDEKMSDIFNQAEKKFRWITSSLKPIRDKYGGKDFLLLLQRWASENPHLLINTATEPKYGEVHKRAVRIFYMFEKGMKTFLSQFERIARVVGYYIKGAEIVKGDRAREKHMNVLSSAHRAGKEGVLAYQILFDLSKFSQKFNHKIIDAATKVIGELVGYPEYSQISDLFKASFLYVSSRNTDKAYVGVLGAFEGFLNFLWTNIHATVMDIALRDCGRSGDLAAYSDDGLLMFTMNAKPNAPVAVIQSELTGIIESIKKTYTDFGLDFNLGKTLISRSLAEFLGVIQYKGHRFPTWMKELCHLGIPDDIPLIRSMGQEITDVSSQMSALMKAGMPPFSAAFVGYLEIFMGPARRLIDIAAEVRGSLPPISSSNIELKVICAICCLNQSFGGVRIPDPITTTMTADFDPTSEMLYDLKNYLRIFPDSSGIIDYLYDSVKPTDDYTSLFLGAAPVHTEGVKYSMGMVRSKIAQQIRRRIHVSSDHPLSKKSAPELHEAIENIENIYLPSITSLTRYVVPSILYEKALAPTKSSSVARLLKKFRIRSIQKYDTTSMKNQVKELMIVLQRSSGRNLPKVDELYSMSYPKLSFAPSLPSAREITKLSTESVPVSYEVTVSRRERLDDQGSYRFLNQDYYDDLVPPLVTTDVNIQHLMNAPDLVSHCMRGIYSELIASSAQGHDLTGLVKAICALNKCPPLYPSILTPLHDMRKIAVANRKKSIHRVYWSEAVKNAIKLTRMGPLNHYMTATSNVHYSLIVTSVLSRIQFLLTGSNFSKRNHRFFYEVSSELIESTRMVPMLNKGPAVGLELLRHNKFEIPHAVIRAIEYEVIRTVDATRQELVDNLLVGRMGMLPDFQKIGAGDSVLDPLKYAVVWSLINRIDSVVDGSYGVTGVTQTAIRAAPVENTPIDLVDLAVIYRAYKNIRKSEVSVAVKEFFEISSDRLRWLSGGVMTESVAEETLNAVAQIGLMTTLDKDSLSSAKAVLVYNSMLIADGISMIYYSLDSHSETSDTKKMSPARVSAMRRVVDALISQFFKRTAKKGKGKEVGEIASSYNVGSGSQHNNDLIKIALMMIRGSMRGSVHRVESFNNRVASDWIQAFISVVKEYVNTLPREYTTPLPGEHQYFGKCRELTPDHITRLEHELRVKVLGYIDYDLGSPDQYDQLIKFFLKLGEWGYIQTIFKTVKDIRMTELINDVYVNMVRPAIMMVRTVSYNTVTKAIKEQSKSYEKCHQFQYSIEEAIFKLTSGTYPDEGQLDFLAQEPYNHYRYIAGPLESLRISVFFPNDMPMNFAPALSYSLSLPLLFAAGYTAFKSVEVIGHANPLYFTELFTMSFAELSLPFDQRGIPLTLFHGLSEYDIWFGLSSWKRTNKGPVLVSVEIPPAATTFSLGLISYLTSQRYSYATIALSSDLQGVSIYVVSIIDEELPIIEKADREFNNEVCSLGDGAICNYLEDILHGNSDILASLYLSPMQQAGIPVYSHYHYSGKVIALSVEEELLDRHKVSFVETSRPSKSSELYASLPHKVSAYIIRCHMMRLADNDAITNVMASFVYYVKALYPDINFEELCTFVGDLIDKRETEIDQSYVIKHLAAPLVSMRPINPSSFPSMAQLNEREIPDPVFPEFSDWEGSEIYAKTLLKLSCAEILEPKEKGLLMAYISHNLKGLDAEQAWMVLISGRPDQRRNPARRRVVNRSQKLIEEESSSEQALIEANKEKEAPPFLSRAEVIETQELFRGSFGEAIFRRDLDRADTPEEKREQLKSILMTDGWDPYTIELVDHITDEEVDQWSELDPLSRSDVVTVRSEEIRNSLLEKGGVK